MNKPLDYDRSQAVSVGNYEKPSAGAYVMHIVNAYEVQSKTNRLMMVLCLDIFDGKHKGNFKKLYDFLKSKNSETKWPCTYRRCTDGDQTAYFKGDIKNIEASNKNFQFNFEEKTLIGKIVGCMLREKETVNGKIILEPAFLCTADKARSGELSAPERKRKSSSGYEQPLCDYNQFQNDDLPF